MYKCGACRNKMRVKFGKKMLFLNRGEFAPRDGRSTQWAFFQEKKFNTHFREKKILKYLKFFDKGDFQTAADLYSEKKSNSIIPNERIQLTINQRDKRKLFFSPRNYIKWRRVMLFFHFIFFVDVCFRKNN